ncbi:PREDICTED: uncharacterized protein LOC106805344 isoform X2 [Priapulus caudatus]|uniref:Uncharacterized protein LOC106805344 isoform X2 n=1 Tax=Priapulus caudatus TaxID=37621 RepID=A0ABM1DR24_PRICU|nr:PREDICTED: uncharacterized protein LOC106805344 isoform X2 [Priapulus caudatus]
MTGNSKKVPHNKVKGHRHQYATYVNQNRNALVRKYPFLRPDQIRRKLRQMWEAEKLPKALPQPTIASHGEKVATSKKPPIRNKAALSSRPLQSNNFSYDDSSDNSSDVTGEVTNKLLSYRQAYKPLVPSVSSLQNDKPDVQSRGTGQDVIGRADIFPPVHINTHDFKENTGRKKYKGKKSANSNNDTASEDVWKTRKTYTPGNNVKLAPPIVVSQTTIMPPGILVLSETKAKQPKLSSRVSFSEVTESLIISQDTVDASSQSTQCSNQEDVPEIHRERDPSVKEEKIIKTDARVTVRSTRGIKKLRELKLTEDKLGSCAASTQLEEQENKPAKETASMMSKSQRSKSARRKPQQVTSRVRKKTKPAHEQMRSEGARGQTSMPFCSYDFDEINASELNIETEMSLKQMPFPVTETTFSPVTELADDVIDSPESLDGRLLDIAVKPNLVTSHRLESIPTRMTQAVKEKGQKENQDRPGKARNIQPKVRRDGREQEQQDKVDIAGDASSLLPTRKLRSRRVVGKDELKEAPKDSSPSLSCASESYEPSTLPNTGPNEAAMQDVPASLAVTTRRVIGRRKKLDGDNPQPTDRGKNTTHDASPENATVGLARNAGKPREDVSKLVRLPRFDALGFRPAKFLTSTPMPVGNVCGSPGHITVCADVHARHEMSPLRPAAVARNASGDALSRRGVPNGSIVFIQPTLSPAGTPVKGKKGRWKGKPLKKRASPVRKTDIEAVQTRSGEKPPVQEAPCEKEEVTGDAPVTTRSSELALNRAVNRMRDIMASSPPLLTFDLEDSASPNLSHASSNSDEYLVQLTDEMIDGDHLSCIGTVPTLSPPEPEHTKTNGPQKKSVTAKSALTRRSKPSKREVTHTIVKQQQQKKKQQQQQQQQQQRMSNPNKEMRIEDMFDLPDDKAVYKTRGYKRRQVLSTQPTKKRAEDGHDTWI